jgi:hypothetical protein
MQDKNKKYTSWMGIDAEERRERQGKNMSIEVVVFFCTYMLTFK